MSDKEFVWEIKDLCKQDWRFRKEDVLRLVEIIEKSEQHKQAFIEWLEKEATANAGWMEEDFLRGVISKAKEML